MSDENSSVDQKRGSNIAATDDSSNPATKYSVHLEDGGSTKITIKKKSASDNSGECQNGNLKTVNVKFPTENLEQHDGDKFNEKCEPQIKTTQTVNEIDGKRRRSAGLNSSAEESQSPKVRQSKKKSKVEEKREEIYSDFQPWVIQAYGDAAKTKTITLKKLNRIINALNGKESNRPDSSKFRFWVKTKGFTTQKPPGFMNMAFEEDETSCQKFPVVYVLQLSDTGVRSYRQVAVVEHFFDIIYQVHVALGTKRCGRHAGQKRTYRTITETYAFLPREAVSKFLSLCTECRNNQQKSHNRSRVMDNKGSNGNIKVSGVDWEERISGVASARHEPPPPYSSVRLYKPYMESNNNNNSQARSQQYRNNNNTQNSNIKVEHPLLCTTQQAVAPELITYYQLLKSFYDNASRLSRSSGQILPPLLPPSLVQADRSKNFNISNLIGSNQNYQQQLHQHQLYTNGQLQSPHPLKQHQHQVSNYSAECQRSQNQVDLASQVQSQTNETVTEQTEPNVIKKNININIEENGCEGFHQRAHALPDEHTKTQYESNNIVINSVDVSINVSSNNNCSESELKISCKTTPPKKRFSSGFVGESKNDDKDDDLDEKSPSKISVRSDDSVSGEQNNIKSKGLEVLATVTSEPITSTYLQWTRSMGLTDDDALNLESVGPVPSIPLSEASDPATDNNPYSIKDADKLRLMLLAWNYQNNAAVQNGTEGPDFNTMSALWAQYQNALSLTSPKMPPQTPQRNLDESNTSETPDDHNSSEQKDDEDSEDDSEDKLEPTPHDPERLKAFNMFVRLFVDENLDRMIPISKQPKEKVQAILDSCTRQFPEFSERARKRIRTYLKSCRRNKRTRDGWENMTRPTPAHLTSVQAEQILAQACENESMNAKRMRMGLEPLGHNSEPGAIPLVGRRSPSDAVDTVSVPSPATIAKISPIASQNQMNQSNGALVNPRNTPEPSGGPTPTPSQISSSPFKPELPPRDLNPSYSFPSHMMSGGTATNSNSNGPTDLSLKRPVFPHKLSPSEMAAVKQLITGYRESAAFLLRSADELEQLLLQQ